MKWRLIMDRMNKLKNTTETLSWQPLKVVDCLKDESFREIHNFSNISNHSNKSDIHLKSIQNLTLSAEIGNFWQI